MNSKERKCNPTFREGSFEILFKSIQQLTISKRNFAFN